jgi:hypothetical protein
MYLFTDERENAVQRKCRHRHLKIKISGCQGYVGMGWLIKVKTLSRFFLADNGKKKG